MKSSLFADDLHSGYENIYVGNTVSRNVTGLNSSTEYYYRVRAHNSGGTSSNSNTINVTTLITSLENDIINKIDILSNQGSIIIKTHNGSIINGLLTVYDMNGVEVISQNIYGQEKIIRTNLADGAYIVHLDMQSHSVKQLIIINKHK